MITPVTFDLANHQTLQKQNIVLFNFHFYALIVRVTVITNSPLIDKTCRGDFLVKCRIFIGGYYDNLGLNMQWRFLRNYGIRNS